MSLVRKNGGTEMQVNHTTQPGQSGNMDDMDHTDTNNREHSDTEILSTEKRILVPLDGSPLAEMALPHAVALAQATNCGLVLLRVVPPISVTIPFAGLIEESARLWDIYDEEPEFAGHYLHEVVERLAPMKLEVETHVAEGLPADLIVEYARDHPAVTAIAMSTHGRSGLGAWIFGSVAEKVVNSAPVPLLLIRPDGKHDAPEMLDIPRYRTLLVPLDGSAFAAQALEQAKTLGQGGARLVLLAVASTPFDLKLVKSAAGADWSAMPWYTPAARMAKYLDSVIGPMSQSGIPIEAQITYGDIADEILKAAAFVEADLIVMATHGLSGLGHVILGSVATRVAQSTHVPLLLVRAKKQEEIHNVTPERSLVGATA
jgi:nucleotide-binding universal stress UspA family protein